MLPASGFARALREAAPGLARRFFAVSTRPCASRERVRAAFSTAARGGVGRVAPAEKRWVRAFTAAARRRTAAAAALEHAVVAEAAAAGARQSAKKARFPETSSNAVAYWLLGSAASVFGIVIFGGLTRLTESGYVSSRAGAAVGLS